MVGNTGQEYVAERGINHDPTIGQGSRIDSCTEYRVDLDATTSIVWFASRKPVYAVLASRSRRIAGSTHIRVRGGFDSLPFRNHLKLAIPSILTHGYLTGSAFCCRLLRTEYSVQRQLVPGYWPSPGRSIAQHGGDVPGICHAHLRLRLAWLSLPRSPPLVAKQQRNEYDASKIDEAGGSEECFDAPCRTRPCTKTRFPKGLPRIRASHLQTIDQTAGCRVALDGGTRYGGQGQDRARFLTRITDPFAEGKVLLYSQKKKNRDIGL
jgi:hypothetical protein